MNLYRRIKGNRPTDAEHVHANDVMVNRRAGLDAGVITVFDNDPEAAKMDGLKLERATKEQLDA